MVLNGLKQQLTGLKTINYNKIDIGVIGIIVFAFLLPIHQKLSTLFILFLSAFCLFKIKSIDLKIFKKFTPFILLYLLYAIAYYKDNYIFGGFMFEQKASFIAFPLVFSVIKLNNLNVKTILKYFVYGCVFIYLLSFIIALYNSVSTNPLEFNPVVSSYRDLTNKPNTPILLSNYFLANNFFQNMNSNFLAVYYSFSIYILLQFKKLFKYRAIIITILIIGVFQIFSVIGILCLIFVFLLNLKPAFYKPIALTTFSVFLFFLVFTTYNSYSTDKNEIIYKLEKIDSRTIIWPVAVNSLVEKPFLGLGVKNSQKVLDLNYPKTGNFGFISQLRKIDAHNMYIQVLLELGLVGFCVFLFSIIKFFKKTSLHLYKNFADVFILLNLVIFLTESALATYAGLSFFSFFYCLFVFNNLKQNNN